MFRFRMTNCSEICLGSSGPALMSNIRRMNIVDKQGLKDTIIIPTFLILGKNMLDYWIGNWYHNSVNIH